MKVKDLKGLAVLSLGDGARLGHITEVFLDLGQLKVAALDISEGGQQAIIPFTDVQAIGPDAATVTNSQVIQGASPTNPLSTLPNLKTVTKLKVVDETGTLLGTVGDLDFDPRNGQITQVEAHRGGVLGLGGTTFHILAQTIRSVGAEVMVVTPPKSSLASGAEASSQS